MISDKVELTDEIEKSICQLKSVLFARVEMSDEITEIHVVSNIERNVKQVVRDIESLLAARFGIKINHNIVSVALINETDETVKQQQQQQQKRLAYEELSTSIKRNIFECRICLSCGDKMYEGTASGALSVRERIIAESVISAIHQYINNTSMFAVAEVKNIEVANKSAVVVCISVNKQQKAIKTEYLIGTALINDDIQPCVVRATLCAVNRVLPLFCIG